MSFRETDFTEFRADQLKVFCHRIAKINKNTDLINLVAGERDYVGFCRKITSADQASRKMFSAFCRQHHHDPKDILLKISMVATVLGIYKQADYYSILGLAPDADDEAIKKAYRRKAKFLHPDKLGGEEGSSDEFIELHKAYTHLSDPELRKVYDTMPNPMGLWDSGYRRDHAPLRQPNLGAILKKNWLMAGAVIIVAGACIVYLQPSRPFDAESAFYVATETAVTSGETAAQMSERPIASDKIVSIGGGEAKTAANQLDDGALPPEIDAHGDDPQPSSVKIAKASDLQRDVVQKTAAVTVISAIQKKRVLSFLKAYAKAYEKRNFKHFQSFFEEHALEQGVPFRTQQVNYRKTFSKIKKVKYKIKLSSVSQVEGTDETIAEGHFSARYKIPGKGWGRTKGTIRMVLRDTAHGLLISKMDYEMTK